MSTSVIEPGTRLAGRYRLDERFSESAGSTLWKATDEILARAVAVRTFPPDFPRISEVVTAARAASRLTDPRLTQVFDADDSGELAYVVSEWVTGETLEQMVAGGGPMDPGRAATLLFEAAQALASAHLAGLSHLRLTTRDLLWTTGSTVKILGLGVDAALVGLSVEDPKLADTRGLARLLYTALTAHWPGTGDDADPRGKLPTAPESNGLICRPGQVVAGLPLPLDTLTCRALGLLDDQPVTTPAALAEGLSRMPRIPLPIFAGLAQGPPPSVIPRPGTANAPNSVHAPNSMPQPSPLPQPAPAPMPAQAAQPSHYAPAGPRHAAGSTTQMLPPGALQRKDRRPLIVLAAGAAALVIGIGAWQLSQGGGGKTKESVTSSSQAGRGGTTAPGQVKLTPVNVAGFDPTRPDHRDSAVGKNARTALQPHSSWHSQTYTDASFGSLKDGIGLLVDMGSSVQIGKVEVTVPGSGPGTLELMVGDARTSLGAFHKVARNAAATGTVEFTAAQGTAGRYVLLWFTKLPQAADGGFRAQLAGVSVYGRQG